MALADHNLSISPFDLEAGAGSRGALLSAESDGRADVDPEGRLAASVATDGTIRGAELATGSPTLFVTPRPGFELTSLVFEPSGGFLAAAEIRADPATGAAAEHAIVRIDRQGNVAVLARSATTRYSRLRPSRDGERLAVDALATDQDIVLFDVP
jgi:hypothetical protein